MTPALYAIGFDVFAALERVFESSRTTRARRDYSLTFSTNALDEQWGFATYSLTPLNLRDEIRHPVLDAIVLLFIEVRPEGGRFFIDTKKGRVFYKTDTKSHPVSLPSTDEITFLQFRRVVGLGESYRVDRPLELGRLQHHHLRFGPDSH